MTTDTDDESLVNRIIKHLVQLVEDASWRVREEVINSISVYIAKNIRVFTRVAYTHQQQQQCEDDSPHDPTLLVQNAVWRAILCLAMDPVERVSRLAGHIVDELNMSFMFPAAAAASRGQEADVVFVPYSAPNSSDDYLNIGGREGGRQGQPGVRLLRTHIHREMPRVELESVLPVTSMFLDDMLRDLARSEQPSDPIDKQPTATNMKREAWLGFELEDAQQSLTSPKTAFAVIDNEHVVNCATFTNGHRLVCGDRSSMLTVWHTHRPSLTRTNVFPNGKSSGNISSLVSIALTPPLHPLLAVSSTDGCIRVWQDYDYGNERLASAWSLLDCADTGSVMTGHVGRLVYSEGRDKIVSVWEPEHEAIVSRRHLNHRLLSICNLGDTVVLGMEGGRVGIVDERVKEVVRMGSVFEDNGGGGARRVGLTLFDHHIMLSYLHSSFSSLITINCNVGMDTLY
jgi:hypothetical protein